VQLQVSEHARRDFLEGGWRCGCHVGIIAYDGAGVLLWRF
jgi:hypothetical protein